MIPSLPAYILPGFIDEQIFRQRIIRKWFPKPDYFQIFPFLLWGSGSCANRKKHCSKSKTTQRFFGSADPKRYNSRRKISCPGKSIPHPCRNLRRKIRRGGREDSVRIHRSRIPIIHEKTRFRDRPDLCHTCSGAGIAHVFPGRDTCKGLGRRTRAA